MITSDAGELVKRLRGAQEFADKYGGVHTTLFATAADALESAEKQLADARKALAAVDATAALNREFNRYMVEPHAIEMVVLALATLSTGREEPRKYLGIGGMHFTEVDKDATPDFPDPDDSELEGN